jgi:hypothetical protein
MRWLAVILGTFTLFCGAALLGAFLLQDMYPQPRPLQSARWLFKSGKYKREVLAQPTGPATELKHIEWDGWGWGGNDTVVYLVFDPDNALAHGASSGSAGKYSGIPCEVYRVRRLESHWYTVQFYTDSDWSHCY